MATTMRRELALNGRFLDAQANCLGLASDPQIGEVLRALDLLDLDAVEPPIEPVAKLPDVLRPA